MVGSGFIANERDATARRVAGLENTLRACWRHACEADGIEPSATAVVFSDGNRFVPFLSIIRRQLEEARAALGNFGYGGLVIEGGRAVLEKPAKKSRK